MSSINRGLPSRLDFTILTPSSATKASYGRVLVCRRASCEDAPSSPASGAERSKAIFFRLSAIQIAVYIGIIAILTRHALSRLVVAALGISSDSRSDGSKKFNTITESLDLRGTTRRLVLKGHVLALSACISAAIQEALAKEPDFSMEELKRTIAHDFQHNQYYITGNLTPSIFTADCLFKDPTTKVQGVQTYSKAVAALFDKASSRADLISIEIADAHTIKTRWRFAASLNVPGKPVLKPYTGTTLYSINAQGLIYEHREEWDISALDAFVSILFPSFGAPAAPAVEHPIDL